MNQVARYFVAAKKPTTPEEAPLPATPYRIYRITSSPVGSRAERECVFEGTFEKDDPRVLGPENFAVEVERYTKLKEDELYVEFEEDEVWVYLCHIAPQGHFINACSTCGMHLCEEALA